MSPDGTAPVTSAHMPSSRLRRASIDPPIEGAALFALSRRVAYGSKKPSTWVTSTIVGVSPATVSS